MTIIAFILLAFGPLLLDMYHRKSGEVSLKSASLWSVAYVASALAFALFLALWEGAEPASQFLAGYSIEKSLSIDNLLIFGTIFRYFGIPAKSQYRVLHYGIIGSVVLRLSFIALGLAMFAVFGRLLDVAFGAFVMWTAWKLQRNEDGEKEIDHASRWYIKWTKRIFPVSPLASEQFFIRTKISVFDAVPTATPLFLCLVAIEVTDILFAFDSVPAVLGVTQRTILVYASIMFAVIGLRSLYFVLESLLAYTTNLAKAMGIILLFVGAKLMLHGLFKVEIPATATLAVVLVSFVFCAADLMRPKSKETVK